MSKTISDLANLCESFLKETATFCEGMKEREKMVVYAAIYKSFLSVPRATKTVEHIETPPKKVEKVEKAEKAEKVEKKECSFNPDKNGECYSVCSKEKPEDFQKCLENFVGTVKEATSKKPAEEKKPKEKDFWGYEVGKNTANFNKALSEGFCSKEDLAEEFDTSEQNIAVHLSKLKQRGFIIKTKTREGVKYYKLTHLRADDNAE